MFLHCSEYEKLRDVILFLDMIPKLDYWVLKVSYLSIRIEVSLLYGTLLVVFTDSSD